MGFSYVEDIVGVQEGSPESSPSPVAAERHFSITPAREHGPQPEGKRGVPEYIYDNKGIMIRLSKHGVQPMQI